MPARIVITGGPGSGKTESLNRLQVLPRFRNFAFLNELARELLEQNPDLRCHTNAFHAEIYRRQTAREKELGSQSFIADRGTVDAFAFHPETLSIVDTTIEAEYRRYDSVIQLGSAAALGTMYYAVDDIRTEPIQRALEIERAIKQVWQAHPDFHFIPADPDFESKFRRLVKTLDGCVERCAPATE